MTAQTYDDLGRLATRELVDIVAGNPGAFDNYKYSARGLVAHTDPLGQTARYFHDAFGRKTIETNANNELTQFAYDSAGSLIALTDAKSQVTRWNYDQYVSS